MRMARSRQRRDPGTAPVAVAGGLAAPALVRRDGRTMPNRGAGINAPTGPSPHRPAASFRPALLWAHLTVRLLSALLVLMILTVGAVYLNGAAHDRPTGDLTGTELLCLPVAAVVMLFLDVKVSALISRGAVRPPLVAAPEPPQPTDRALCLSPLQDGTYTAGGDVRLSSPQP